jgi:hypothetical protein
MARLDTYKKDTEVNGLDFLAGSSYVTTGINGPIYETTKFSMLDLARFFGSYTNINGFTYDIAQMYQDIQNNISSLASVSIDITTLADATQALAQVDIDLQTAFSNGISAAVSEINLTLTSLSNADLALASVVTNLETSFTTQLTEAVSTINTELISLTTADSALATSITELETTFNTDLTAAVATINTELTTLSTADQALATSITELETSFATDLSDAVATINTELTTLSTADQALATSITELETTFTTDLSEAVATINTELTTLSTADGSLATSITTLETTFTTELSEAVTSISSELTTLSEADLAQAQFVTNLAASLGTTDAEGNLTVSEAFANQVLQTETTTDYAQAAFVTNLASSLGTTDAQGNLTVSEAFANQVLQTETTTDYAQAEFVTNLASSFGTYNEDGSIASFNDATFLEAVTLHVDENSSTAEKAENLRITVGDANSGLVAQANDVTTLAGNLEGYLEASRTINVDANGNVASMQLFADANSSEIRFSADSFKVFNGTEGVAPFEVVGGVVKIKSANIGSVSFGSLSDIPDTFITTVIYADDASGTNPSTTKGTKNFVAFYNGAAKWVNGDPLPSGLTFSQIRGNDGAQGPAGADGQDGQNGADGYTPQKNIDYFDGLDGSNGVNGTDGVPGVDGESANVVVTNASSEQCPNGGKVYQFYVGTTLIDTQIVCNGVDGADGADGAAGTPGAAGAAGVRISTGLLFYQLGSETQPSTPSNSGITYNFDNGTFSSLPTDWGLGTPEMAAGTASNKYWTSRYQVIESSSGSNSGTPSFFTPIRSFAFNQVVTFDSLGSSGTTVIDGSRITTGFIRSNNWDGPDSGETFADAGTALYLNSGAIISKSFVIDTDGNAFFKGDITGATGIFSGALNVNNKFLVNSAGSVQIYGGDLVGNARFEILDDSGNSKYRLYGGGINLNSWTGDNALSGGKIFFGSVAEVYSGNGTTVSGDHPLVINVNGGSKKLITRSDNFQMYNSAGGDGVILTVNGSIRATGNITAYYSSDKRLKENITPIENAIDKINSIGGYEFDWNDNQTDYEGHDIGVIAQEIQGIAPELVTERPDGYLAVKYEKLVAVLIQGMKEQQVQIEELKNKIDGLTK